jgi:hypothetical protein
MNNLVNTKTVIIANVGPSDYNYDEIIEYIKICFMS